MAEVVSTGVSHMCNNTRQKKKQKKKNYPKQVQSRENLLFNTLIKQYMSCIN